ncbi:HSPB1-associated protein 1 homolog [Leguminivora glycinivorella]|uniref:HSPB1-associated protein 1 homolog n=1 Tax=Leguminivora glycinivorella TaxID=1035111 RepID=UPI00200D4CA7|nr:HSPB1-associated protein 1 homolog [Leguminivora glycinivorella]
MTETLSSDLVRKITQNVTVPIVFRDFISDWPLCRWDIEKWCSAFGNKEVPFRCLRKHLVSDEPCWERKCEMKSMPFKDFITKSPTSEQWMYFDYKHLPQWFDEQAEFLKEVSWQKFGYPDKGAADSTLWVGSSGAHTPAHQDTYGYNIVAQLYGKKRWILFPPESGGMKPTRVPYEESSVYSELNFHCPNNMEPFNGLSRGRMVELCAGDALVVPRGWWHYVQNVDSVNIALNMWLPHEKDNSTRVSEALTKIMVAQVCKDLPQDTAKLLVNPNEDDLSDTPLAVLFLQLESVTKSYLDSRRKLRRVKRQRTCDEEANPPDIESCDLQDVLKNHKNLEVPPTITADELIDLLKRNVREFANTGVSFDEDEIDGTRSLCLTKAVIDAFSDSSVIELVKQNLFARMK